MRFSLFMAFCVIFANTAFSASILNEYGSGWSGFYVGINSGYALGNAKVKTTVAEDKNGYFFPGSINSIADNGTVNIHPSGYTGGIQVGYNRYVSSHVVGGLEADIGAFLLNRTKNVTAFYPDFVGEMYNISQRVRTDWLFTFRPRIGYVYGPWLPYITGGLALTHLRYKETFTDNVSLFVPGSIDAFESSSKIRTVAGWTLGGGIECMCFQRCSLFISYLYANFGHIFTAGRLIGFIPDSPGGFLFSTLNHFADLEAHTLRIGINWHL